MAQAYLVSKVEIDAVLLVTIGVSREGWQEVLGVAGANLFTIFKKRDLECIRLQISYKSHAF